MSGAGENKGTPKKKIKRKPKENRNGKSKAAAQAAFLSAYSDGLSIQDACLKAGIGRTTFYTWKENDMRFRSAFSDAMERSVDVMEEEAKRRAVRGVLKPVYYNGKIVGSIREYSDTLLIFLMKGRRPDVFKERANIEHHTYDHKEGAVSRTAAFVERVLGGGGNRDKEGTGQA